MIRASTLSSRRVYHVRSIVYLVAPRRRGKGLHSSGGGFAERRLCLREAARPNCSPYRLTIAAAGSSRMPTPRRSSIDKGALGGYAPNDIFGTSAVNLRKLQLGDRYDYGFPPPRFFNQVLAFVDWYRTGWRRVTPRE
jgi:hypothetical protein